MQLRRDPHDRRAPLVSDERAGDGRRLAVGGRDCSVAQCLEVVGEWWSMLIIRDAFLGVRRFDDFQTRLGISRNILNVRLTLSAA